MNTVEHKTTIYSLNQCKQFINNIASNIDYATFEGILTSTFHYLEEYERKINKEYIRDLKPIFRARYIGDTGFYDGTTQNIVYDVLEETKEQFVVRNDCGHLSTLTKDKFSIIQVSNNKAITSL